MHEARRGRGGLRRSAATRLLIGAFAVGAARPMATGKWSFPSHDKPTPSQVPKSTTPLPPDHAPQKAKRHGLRTAQRLCSDV